MRGERGQDRGQAQEQGEQQADPGDGGHRRLGSGQPYRQTRELTHGRTLGHGGSEEKMLNKAQLSL
ncbi:hypothetical protein GCM10010388_33690 [Streptomyces mauvecolor]